jgi:hypothetical protein
VPTLLGQREKATDTAAKTEAASAERAMVIYDQDHDTFACGDSGQCRAAIREIDPALGGSGLSFSASGGPAGQPANRSYRLAAQGGQNRSFWVDRAAGASPARGCELNGAAQPGGCRVAGAATAGSW